MRPVYLLDRTKNLHQSDGLHFISDSYKNALSSYYKSASITIIYLTNT